MTTPSAAAQRPPVRCKVAFITPSSRVDAEVAAYAEVFRKALARLADIEVVALETASSLGNGAVPIYHLKNDPRFQTIYQAALVRPGMVVLHQAVLHHLLLGSMNEDSYLEEFVYNYGEWLRPLGTRMWNERFTALPAARYFEFPMLRRLVETSQAIVVHNPKARRLVQQALGGNEPSTRVFEIPPWVEAVETAGEPAMAALRARLGIPQEAVVIGCFGPLCGETRIRSLLEAARAVSVPHKILLAGSFVSHEYERALRPLRESMPVIRLPYPAGDDRWRLAQLTDIAVGLCHPGAGQTSPAVLRWMAAGKPVILTDDEETGLFPASSVIRVDAGEAETEMLAHYLYALAGDKEMRDVIGAEARLHVLQNHSLEDAARRYHDAIRQVITREAGLHG